LPDLLFTAAAQRRFKFADQKLQFQLAKLGENLADPAMVGPPCCCDRYALKEKPGR